MINTIYSIYSKTNYKLCDKSINKIYTYYKIRL